MTTLCFSSYLKTIKKAFTKSKGQEKTANLLLDSVNLHINPSVYFDKSKISDLANNKREIDITIQQAAQNQTVVGKAIAYFFDDIMPELSTDTLGDSCLELLTIILNDPSIAKSKKNELQRYYKQGEDSQYEFLARTFLYALQRPNKLENIQKNSFTTSDGPQTINQIVQKPTIVQQFGEKNVHIDHVDTLNL